MQAVLERKEIKETHSKNKQIENENYIPNRLYSLNDTGNTIGVADSGSISQSDLQQLITTNCVVLSDSD